MVWKLEVYCQTLLNNFVVKTQAFQTFTLLYFTWRYCYIPNSGSESKCQSQRERKLGPSQNINARNCKDCTRRVVLLMAPCAIWWKLAAYQYQGWDNFCIKNPIQNLLFPHVNSKKMKMSARFKNKIWCMHLAYVDKLAGDFNGVK